MASARVVATIAGYVAASSVLGVLGWGPIGLAGLPWLWTSSLAADLVFVAGSAASLKLASRAAREGPALGVAAGALMTLGVYAASLAIVLTAPRPDLFRNAGFEMLWLGWPGIVLGGIAPWWSARRSRERTREAARARAREVVLAESRL